MAIIGIILLISGLIVWRWVIGIDYMHKNHPDYKGEDLFGEHKQQENENNNKISN